MPCILLTALKLIARFWGRKGLYCILYSVIQNDPSTTRLPSHYRVDRTILDELPLSCHDRYYYHIDTMVSKTIAAVLVASSTCFSNIDIHLCTNVFPFWIFSVPWGFGCAYPSGHRTRLPIRAEIFVYTRYFRYRTGNSSELNSRSGCETTCATAAASPKIYILSTSVTTG